MDHDFKYSIAVFPTTQTPFISWQDYYTVVQFDLCPYVKATPSRITPLNFLINSHMLDAGFRNNGVQPVMACL